VGRGMGNTPCPRSRQLSRARVHAGRLGSVRNPHGRGAMRVVRNPGAISGHASTFALLCRGSVFQGYDEGQMSTCWLRALWRLPICTCDTPRPGAALAGQAGFVACMSFAQRSAWHIQLCSIASIVELTFVCLRRTARSPPTSTPSPWLPAPASTTTFAPSRGRMAPPPPSPSRIPTSRPSTAPATKQHAGLPIRAVPVHKDTVNQMVRSYECVRA